MILIQGKGVSTGVAVGPLYFYQRASAELSRYEVEDRESEWQRFKAAQAKAIDQLGVLAEKAREEAGDEAEHLTEQFSIQPAEILSAVGVIVFGHQRQEQQQKKDDRCAPRPGRQQQRSRRHP